MKDLNFLIYGDDYDQISTQIESIEKNINASFDETVIDLEDESILTLLESIQTIPFLTEYKCLIVKNSQILLSDTINEKYINNFLDYLKRPSKSTVLIIVFSKKVDESNSIFKQMSKLTNYVKFICGESDLSSIAFNNFSKAGYVIEKDAIELLVSEVDNVSNLNVEIEKLKSYCFDQRRVTRKDVDILVPKNLETNVYELVTAVLKKDKQRAMHVCIDMTSQSAKEMYIISMLLNKFQEIYAVKKLIIGGMGKDDIARIYNVKAGRAYYMMKNASESSLSDIELNVNLLSDLENDIKMGKTDADLGLQLYLLR